MKVWRWIYRILVAVFFGKLIATRIVYDDIFDGSGQVDFALMAVIFGTFARWEEVDQREAKKGKSGKATA